MTATSSEKKPRICKRGHLVEGENVAQNGSPNGACRQCIRDKAREKYWANLEESRASGRARMRKHLGPERGNACLRKTHCPNGHPYDAENLYVAPNGHRQCKTCRRVRVMESWERHKDKRRAENKAWREANAERCRENLLRWIEENRERYNLAHRLKKQRKRAAGTLTTADWALVLEVYGNACLACAKPEVTIDHVIPVSKGGRNEIDNVQPLCGYCNTSKGTKTIDYRPIPIADLMVA